MVVQNMDDQESIEEISVKYRPLPLFRCLKNGADTKEHCVYHHGSGLKQRNSVK